MKRPIGVALVAGIALVASALAVPIKPSRSMFWRILAGQGTGMTIQQMTTTAGTHVYEAQDDGGNANWFVAREGDVTMRRMFASKGTAAVAGDVSAFTTGKWGAGAVASFATGSNDSHGQLTITTSVADTPSASPSVVYTFHDGTYTSVPTCVVAYDTSSTGTFGTPTEAAGFAGSTSVTATATTLTIKQQGTPPATTAATYVYDYVCID